MKIVWEKPKSQDDYANSLIDLVCSASQNDLIVYRTENAAVTGEAASRDRAKIFRAAGIVEARGLASLVLRPTDRANKPRSIEYMLQVR